MCDPFSMTPAARHVGSRTASSEEAAYKQLQNVPDCHIHGIHIKSGGVSFKGECIANDTVERWQVDHIARGLVTVMFTPISPAPFERAVHF